SLPDAPTNNTYSQALQVISGTYPFTWSVISGALPTGLTLSPSGVISGTATNPGTYNFTIEVVDANFIAEMVDLSIIVHPAPDIITSVLPPATLNIEYSQPIIATGGATPYVWSISVGSLPTGIHISDSGLLTGTPVQTGTFVFTIQITDLNSSKTSREFTLEVNPINIETTLLPDVFVGEAYSQILQILGGTSPFGWSISAGSLPTGLTINSSTGEISGSPTVVNIYNFTVQVADANNDVAFKDLSITVHGNTPAGPNINVSSNGVSLTFSEVTQEGQTTVTTSSGGAPPPTGFKLGTPPIYYSIDTTAIFTGDVEVCISWTQGQFNNENNLKLWHYDGAVWTDITTSLDTTNNIICGLTTSFSDFAIFEKKQVAVQIDIKPNTYPNSINLGSNGNVPVAIFSTSEFDATTINPLTVELASAPVELRGNGTPQYSFQDVNSDSLLDLVVHVSTEALQLTETDEIANLIGYTLDNTEVVGSDTVRVVP
ncbi:MAG: Ig domain-containing protein, partial [bacterium]|nr:Ig domain-containing protein [bacterium]